MKTKLTALMVCLVALIATGSIYLISKKIIPLPDLMFCLIFGSCGVWMLLAISLEKHPKWAYFCASLCLGAVAVLAFWAAENHTADIANNFPFVPARWAGFIGPALVWLLGCVSARLALLFFLFAIRTWKQLPILPLIILRYFFQKCKNRSDKDGGSGKQSVVGIAPGVFPQQRHVIGDDTFTQS